MATIDQRTGDGGIGRGITKESGVDDLVTLLNATVDDLTELRTQFIALLAKIDADAGDTGGDSDYESTLTPAALTLAKGS